MYYLHSYILHIYICDYIYDYICMFVHSLNVFFHTRTSLETDPMQVVMPPDRVPEGWELFTQAAARF